MDPLTQGLLGAAATQAVFTRHLGRWAALIGFVAGALPDIDVLWINPSDPVHEFIYHRHITHSLFFIPIGGLLASLLFIFSPRQRGRRSAVLAAATLAWATHGLLDSCTSYGTQYLLPFTNQRVAFDNLPIIDIFFTLVLFTGVAITTWSRKPRAIRICLGIAIAYALCGIAMHSRAISAQNQLAESRNHTIQHGRAMPAPGTLILWRSIYLTPDGTLHADAIRTPWLGRTLVRQGESKPLATFQENVAPADHGDTPEARRVFDTFSWFSDDFIISLDHNPPIIIDARYSLALHAFEPLWGITYTPEGPANWMTEERSAYASSLLKTLLHGHPSYHPL